MITILPFNVNRRNDIQIKLKMLFKITKICFIHIIINNLK